MTPERLYITSLLTDREMPRLAEILRERKEKIIKRWDEAVCTTMPLADELTTKQVRDSIPKVLDQMAFALESRDPAETERLYDVTRDHGEVRFHESYSVRDLIMEYRILRVIVLEELWQAMLAHNTAFEGADMIAVNIALDVAVQQSVAAFVEFQHAQLRSAVAAETKYLSYLSHDLRNNLNNITLTMDLLELDLRNVPTAKDQYESVVAARRSIWETMEGMERLMQAERLNRKAIRPQFRATNMRALIDRVVLPMIQHAREKGLGLIIEVQHDLVLHTDEELMRLVVQNLVGNAIKYSHRGTIRLRAQIQNNDAKRWMLTISDEGVGIAPEHQAKLFEAFARGETHGEAGVGLGLAIASSAAKLMGAELRVASEVGRGSTFTLIFSEEADTRRQD